MIASAFSAPFTNAAQYNPYNPWSLSSQNPQGPQGLGINPFAFQQYAQNQPLSSAPLSSIAGQVPGLQQLQQTIPLLQIVPQQLQHLQQIVQLLPGQLQQLHQLIQFVPQQLQHFQQTTQSQQPGQFQQPSQLQQPFAYGPGVGGFAVTAPWGIGPQAFGAQPSHVM